MRSGRLKHFIVIEGLSTKSNEFGEEENSVYSEKLKARADVVYDSGNRTNDNGEIFYSYTKTFILWDYFDEKVNEFDRIVYKGNYYKILSKELDEPNKLLYLKTELVNE